MRYDSAGAVPITYTMETGAGSETVRMVEADEHYIVNWHTKDFDLDATERYRISVLVAGAELGYADVDVVSKGNQLKNRGSWPLGDRASSDRCRRWQNGRVA